MLSILFFSTFFLTLSLLSLLFLSFSLYTNKLRSPRPESNPDTAACKDDSISPPAPELSLAESEGLSGQLDRDSDPAQGQGPKRKKKRARKKSKRPDLDKEEEQSIGGGDEKKVVGSGLSADLGSRDKPELICLYPFTSSGSATQRRIKQQYDELVKSHDSKGLALAQVGEFAKCLVEARNELQHKSEVIHRKFSIAKALLFKADKSSFDRVRQQIYKLELEQKRLEEDAFVYNWLQQQLKISPAYKKMLEISASMELKAKSGELVESKDADLPEISFEEFLAQEKKDSFWQKFGKSRSCSG
ncbi:uncharacterized protein LOC116201724 [Punica granatum]|uniref:Uncharacterized protein LOC116201724 n=1 Tax=Punica granatum TaxID=22663 RepID=A0A6P8CXZ6_PUNGR|nr:uncharacterized protein LOC116201724 [Punica granatum]